MALYVLKWVVGMIVLAVGVLFGLSVALNAKSTSADVYMMSAATIIAISFMIVGTNIFFMGSSDMKRNKEIKKNKELLTKAEVLSSKERIESYRNIR